METYIWGMGVIIISLFVYAFWYTRRHAHDEPAASEVNVGTYIPSRRKNGARRFAIVLTFLSIVGGLLAIIIEPSFSIILAIISDILFAAVFYAIASLVDRQNEMIELLISMQQEYPPKTNSNPAM